MEFWTWLVQSGLIAGNAAYYSGRQANKAEFAHAIRTAINNLGGASDPRAAVEFYRRLRDTGAYAGDFNYYASGSAAAGEIEHLINTAAGFFGSTSYVPYVPPPAPARPPAQPPAPPPTPNPPPAQTPTPPTPTPPPAPPPPEPIDYEAKVAALYPYLPQDLIRIFADAWANTGDESLALAEMRASAEYAAAFPGIKRADGSMRMSEAEWFSTREAYGRLFSEYGLNSSIFTDRFTELMENDVSASELAGRLGAAYEAFVTNIPQVAQVYAQYGGIEMTEQALFASFIDPTVGEQILQRRISVAQVGGEALARGFSIGQQFAEQLAFAGVDQMKARQLFSTAEGQLPTLDELARRFRDPDPTFDLEEYAAASIFGDADQTRRINRLLAQSRSLFSEQIGTIRTSQELAVTGLSAR